MIVVFLTVAVLLSSGVGSPPPVASAPAPAATAPAAQPREVVFQFTYDESQEQTTSEFGQPPDTQTMLSGYTGKVVVDFLGPPGDDVVHLSVTETSDAANNKRPIVRELFLRGGGHLYFVGPAPVVDANTEQSPAEGIELFLLLPYLAPDWSGSHPLESGSSWQTDRFGDFQNIGAKYSVSGIAKGVASIEADSTAASPVPGALSLQVRVAYDTGAKLPISLDAYAYWLQGGEVGRDDHAHYHFKLVSDTAAAAPR